MSLPDETDEASKDRAALGQRLRQTMHALVASRSSGATLGSVKQRVRLWQNRRFARTYEDLHRMPRYAAAVDFFLGELYGEPDFSTRDADLVRVMPVMTRMLPAPALNTIIDALAFETLCEELDTALARALGTDRLTVATYARAFCRAGHAELRRRQIAYVGEIGHALDRLTRWPMIGTTLKLMRAPARGAGLTTLQSFLERGFAAFRHMRGAEEFLATIAERETAIVARLFAGDPQPFELEDES